MFKNIDSLMKTVLGILLVLFVIMFVWHGISNEKKVTDLKVTTAQQSGVIKQQEVTIDKQQKTAAITEQVNTDTQVEVKKVEKRHEVIADKLEQKTKAIEQAFANKPSNVDNTIQKQEELSTARIDSLWEGYCAGSTDNQQCKDIEQGVTHA